MAQFLASDLTLVLFSVVFGALVGVYWERQRSERQNEGLRRDNGGRD